MKPATRGSTGGGVTAKPISDEQVAQMRPGGLEKGLSTEQVIQIIGLVLDGGSIREIADHMGLNRRQVEDAQMRFVIDGVHFTWGQLFALAEGARASFQAARAEAGARQFSYQKWAETARVNGIEALIEAKQSILGELHSVNDKGEFNVKRSIGDLVQIEKLLAAFRGEATEIVEQRRTDIRVMAMIMAASTNEVIQDPQVRSRLLGEVERRFQTYVSGNANVERLTK